MKEKDKINSQENVFADRYMVRDSIAWSVWYYME